MSERIPRPAEIVVDPDERTDEQSPKPLRCQAGSRAPEGGCQRDATTWVGPGERSFPVCDEHARLFEVVDEANDWSLTREITADWLRMAEAWRLPELEQLAVNAHEHAKLEYLKAHAKVDLALEIADSRRQDARVPAQLGPKESEELRRRIQRCDKLTNAYTTIERVPEGEMEEDVRDRTLAVLVEEKERAHREYEEYRQKLGLEAVRAK